MRNPTIFVKTENGPVLINESDFDPDNHVLCDAEGTETPSIDEPVATEPVQKFVMPVGDKFYITDQTGEKKLVRKSFKTEAEAMDHIKAM